MGSRLEDQPFKSREQAKAEVRKCALFGDTCQYFSFLFAGLAVIGEASNTTLGLEPISWLLLAIVAGLNAIIGHMHIVVAKHLLGIEAFIDKTLPKPTSKPNSFYSMNMLLLLFKRFST
jgi:hypothetical protein